MLSDLCIINLNQQKYADIIIPEGGSKVAIDIMTTKIQRLLVALTNMYFRIKLTC